MQSRCSRQLSYISLRCNHHPLNSLRRLLQLFHRRSFRSIRSAGSVFEVVPSMYDRQNEAGGTGNPYTAFDAWWPVFQGLHNVIGFCTIMFYPDDDLQWGFGFDASVGGDLNAAWFQEVAAYDGDDGTYTSQHLKGRTSGPLRPRIDNDRRPRPRAVDLQRKSGKPHPQRFGTSG